MAVHIKRRYRLSLLLIGTTLVIGLFASFYAYRKHQLRSESLSLRHEGMSAFDQKQYFDAMHKIGKYLLRYPDDVEATHAYAQARLHVTEPGNKHLSQAIGVFRRLLDLEPGHPTARRQLLALYVETGYRNETLDTAEILIDQNPDDVEAVRAKLDALIYLRQFDKAIAFADTYLAATSNRRPVAEVRNEATRFKAVALAAERRFEQALVLAEQYNEAVPTDLEGHLLTFRLLTELGRPTKDLALRAQQLRQTHPDDPKFELLQAIAYRLDNDRINSVKWLRVVAGRQPNDLPLIKRLVIELDAVGLVQEATSALETAVRQTDDIWLQQGLASRLIQAGRSDAVVELVTEQIPIDLQSTNTDSELLGLYALALFRLDRGDETDPIINALVSHKDDPIAEAWVLFHREVSANKHPEPVSTVKACQDALLRHPHNPFVLYTIGQAYALLGETDLAIDAWGKASGYAPAWSTPLVHMSRSLLATQRPESAVRMAQLAYQRSPNSVDAAASLVVAAAASLDTIEEEKIQGLIALARRIQAVRPGEPRTLPAMISLLARAGQTDAAKATLQAALDAEDRPSQQTLIHLATVSRIAGLGLEDACLKLSKQAHGVTPELAYRTAIQLLDRGRPDQGLAALEAASASSGSADAVAWKIARARYRDAMGDPAAKSAWIALGDHYPENVNVQQLAIKSRGAWQDRQFIDRTIDRLQALSGEDGLSWRVARARWLIDGSSEEREVANAIELLNDVIRVTPRLAEPRLLLARCYEKMGNTSGSIEHLQAAAQLRPNDPDITLSLASLFQSLGELDQSLLYVDKFIELSSEMSPDHARRAARLLVLLGRSESAMTLLEGLYKQDERDITTALLLAELYRRHGELEKTEKICQTLLKKPTAEVVKFVAQLYASQGHKKHAEEILTMLEDLSLQPGEREKIIGDYHARTGGQKKALQQYIAATESAPSNPDGWRDLIAFRIGLGEIDQAVTTAKRALDIIPNDDELAYFVQQSDLIVAASENARLRPMVIGLLGDPDHRSVAAEALQIFADGKKKKISAYDVVSKLHQLANHHTRHLALQSLVTQALIATGRREDAIVVSTRLAQTFPNAVQAQRLAAEALAAAGRWDEVLAVSQRWRQQSVDDTVTPDLMIAEANLRLGNIQDAAVPLKPYLKKATDQPMEHAPIIVLHARTLIATDNTRKAEALLAPLLDSAPIWRATWMRLATQSIRDPDTSAAWLDKIEPHVPADHFDERAALVQSWEALATQANSRQYHQRAKHMIDQIVQEPEANAHCWLIHGVMSETATQPGRAEASYRKALELDGNLHVAKNNLAMLLIQREGHLEEALELARAAVAAWPENPSYHDTLALVQAKSRDYNAALDSIKTAIDLDPTNPQWQNRLSTLQDESNHGQ